MPGHINLDDALQMEFEIKNRTGYGGPEGKSFDAATARDIEFKRQGVYSRNTTWSVFIYIVERIAELEGIYRTTQNLRLFSWEQSRYLFRFDRYIDYVMIEVAPGLFALYKK
jgi:hypothetical protein